MRKGKLTPTQAALLDKLQNVSYPASYEYLKQYAELDSFDITFNTLFLKGYFSRVETNDFSNQYNLI